VDDPEVRGLIPFINRSVLTYGQSEGADYRITSIRAEGAASAFQLATPNHGELRLRVNAPGLHNVLNAAATTAVALDEGLSVEAVTQGLATFAGVGRRFERLGALAHRRGKAYLVDDYGHHPTEVEATLNSVAQVWPDSRVVMIYQPHRFTRTRDLYEDFVRVLSRCDVLILLDVYAAGEAEIPGADSKALARSIRSRGHVEPIYAASIEEVPQILADLLNDQDVVITQGAGNITSLAHSLTQMKSEGLSHVD
jgi:UDP-N-acetylmuramate--alanine ligase